LYSSRTKSEGKLGTDFQTRDSGPVRSLVYAGREKTPREFAHCSIG
jgi:hypothetical protein